MTYFRDSMAPMLNWWPVKVIVVAVFACYVAGACYGITRIEEGLERRKLSRSDSYSVEFYDREDFYFREFPYRIQVKVSVMGVVYIIKERRVMWKSCPSICL
jgi:hypothetical protein